MQARTVRIGTRGSPLALAQADIVRRSLMAAHGLAAESIEICAIRTAGDRIQDRPLAEAGGKGLFTKELEEALLAGSIDLAVHSMKDMATTLPKGLRIAAVLEREDVRDAFISRAATSIAGLPQGAVVGTSSLRRQAQVLRLRPDLKVVGLRGNVETRLAKIERGVADATLLACAGLNRLRLPVSIAYPIAVDEMLPAVAQGAIGIEICADNSAAADLAAPLDHQPTSLCVTAERAFLARLDGSCRTPIAGLAEVDGSGGLRFRGMILTPDGAQSHSTERKGPAAQAIVLAEAAAAELLASAGPDFLKASG
ncbi:MAG: hydroxymethylbilane synthase [Hyphomicrobiaceae bacterium]